MSKEKIHVHYFPEGHHLCVECGEARAETEWEARERCGEKPFEPPSTEENWEKECKHEHIGLGYIDHGDGTGHPTRPQRCFDCKKTLPEIIRSTRQQVREETLNEVEERTIKIMKAVQEQQGTFKYDSCYEDVLEIIKKLKERR